jgi:hypothetical protein
LSKGAARGLEIAYKLLLLGINRDSRLHRGQGGAHRLAQIGELRIAIGMMAAC